MLGMGVGTFIVLFFFILLTSVFIMSTPCKMPSLCIHHITHSSQRLLPQVIPTIKFYRVLYQLEYLVSLTHALILTYLLTNSLTHSGIVVLILFFAPRSNRYSYSIYEPHHYDSSVIPRIAIGSMMILFTVLTSSYSLICSDVRTNIYYSPSGNFHNI